MADVVEEVIEDLERANKVLMGTDNDVLNGIDIGCAIDEAIQLIRDLQEHNKILWKAKDEFIKFNNFVKEKDNVCEWKLFDGEDNNYHTSCGEYFFLEYGNAEYNGVKYCSCCGRKIKVAE